MSVLQLDEVESKVIEIRGLQVLLDSDVAELYAVETKRVNEAVKNNPQKFPEGYIIELSGDELDVLRSKFSTAKLSKTRSKPKAFTEKGLYMLATILKGEKAIQTTLAMIETFAKLRALSKSVALLAENPEPSQQKLLMQKSGELMADLLDDSLATTDTETTFELNFAVLKLKHTVRKKSES